jgi:hypothetical protein
LLFQELLDLVHAQGELIMKGVLLRGGVTYGPISFSKSRIFGPALVVAHELESRFALYPRIVIDPALISAFRTKPSLRAVHHSLAEEEKYVSRLVRKGDDGIWFVDYLRAMEPELDEPDMYPAVLKAHRTLIIEGAQKFAGLRDVKSKYLWLATYHNGLVSELPGKWLKHYHLKRSDLLVSPDEIAELQEIKSTES